MDTIDIHISRIDHDRNGNLVGRLVACRDSTIVADSGQYRRQLHGGYREAARSWLASRGIVTDERAGGVYWTGENARDRVVDVKVRLTEIS